MGRWRKDPVDGQMYFHLSQSDKAALARLDQQGTT